MSERVDELGTDTVVVLVTFTDPANIDEYTSDYNVSIPILVDPDLNAYRSFGMGRGSIARIWGLRSARRYLELYRTEGRSKWKRPTDDTLQLGGDFVIAPDGTLTYGYWAQGPDDRPHVDALIEAVNEATR